MNKYETIFLIKDNATENQRKEVVDRFKNFLFENGKVTNEEDLGLKRLAYKIQNREQAYYYIIEFEAESDVVVELERLYRITEEVLKFIVVRKEY